MVAEISDDRHHFRLKNTALATTTIIMMIKINISNSCSKYATVFYVCITKANKCNHVNVNLGTNIVIGIH